jgi:hypothetical protein
MEGLYMDIYTWRDKYLHKEIYAWGGNIYRAIHEDKNVWWDTGMGDTCMGEMHARETHRKHTRGKHAWGNTHGEAHTGKHTWGIHAPGDMHAKGDTCTCGDTYAQGDKYTWGKWGEPYPKVFYLCILIQNLWHILFTDAFDLAPCEARAPTLV